MDIPFVPDTFDDGDTLNTDHETFSLTNFSILDGLLDTLDGPIVVRRQQNRNMRVERLRARHEKWRLQIDSLAAVYLKWASKSNTEEKNYMTGCPGDVDSPPEKTSSNVRYYLALSEVIGSHCESASHHCLSQPHSQKGSDQTLPSSGYRASTAIRAKFSFHMVSYPMLPKIPLGL